MNGEFLYLIFANLNEKQVMIKICDFTFDGRIKIDNFKVPELTNLLTKTFTLRVDHLSAK